MFPEFIQVSLYLKGVQIQGAYILYVFGCIYTVGGGGWGIQIRFYSISGTYAVFQ